MADADLDESMGLRNVWMNGNDDSQGFRPVPLARCANRGNVRPVTTPDPPEATLAEVTRKAKSALRKQLRAIRAALPEPALQERSERIAARLLELPELELARGVGLFWPMSEKKEVDLRSVDARLRESGRALYYPYMDATAAGGYRTGFRRVASTQELEERGRGFCEPNPNTPAATRGEIDLIVVPALAADARGHRLGYGGGVYDATLPDYAPPAVTVVVLFDFQLMVELPVTATDVATEIVVTDSRLIRASGRRELRNA